MARNASNIVAVNVVNKDFLGLLAQYSPEFDCLFKGAANLLPRIKAAKDTKHTAAVRVEFHGPKPAYVYPLDHPGVQRLPRARLLRPAQPAACSCRPSSSRTALRTTPASPTATVTPMRSRLNFTYNDPGGGSVTNPLAPLARCRSADVDVARPVQRRHRQPLHG